MKKSMSNARKKQRRASNSLVSVRANEPFLPPQQPELRESVPTASIIGFNGQLFDLVSGTYLLGNGYRAYSPTMRAFYSPDSLSPFGAGGVSRYQYCNLNPINYTDPSGHSVVGIAIGILSFLSTVTAVVSVGLEAGRWAHSQSDPKYSSYLRELSEGFGIASAALGSVAAVAGIGRFVATAAQRGARRGAQTVWGSSATNLNPIADDLFVFDDVYQGKLRLNILGHGSQQGEIFSKSGSFTPEQLENFLRVNNVGYGNYNNIRLLSCWSGYGGNQSFASRFSMITGKTVKGYENVLTSRLQPDFLSNLIAERGFGIVSAAFPDAFSRSKFIINKINPSLGPYAPVKYFMGRRLP